MLEYATNVLGFRGDRVAWEGVMSELMPTRESNIELVQLPLRWPVTEQVGQFGAGPLAVIQRGGRVLRRCRCCGRMIRVYPGDLQ